MIRKLVTWTLVLGVVFWGISDPSGAGHTAHFIASALASGGKSAGKFIRSL